MGALLFGCSGVASAPVPPWSPGDGWEPPPQARVCPQDPDGHIGGEIDPDLCPDYWTCEDLAVGRKRCTNPGPRYPDDGDWECRDEDGWTICEGREWPDGGGGDGWNCESRGDLVICRRRPDYPDDGGGGPWDCHFWNEFRICDGGDFDAGVDRRVDAGVDRREDAGVDGRDAGQPPPPPPLFDDGDDICYWPVDPDDFETTVVVGGGYRFETVDGRDAIHLTLIFSEAFVDNTYGPIRTDPNGPGSAEDWAEEDEDGHQLRELVGSDHAEIGFANIIGQDTDEHGRPRFIYSDPLVVARFDFISEADTPSGYDSLGLEGNGGIQEGEENAGLIIASTTSLARNYNERNCPVSVTSDWDERSAVSPPPDHACGWDTRVIYEVWLDRSAFTPYTETRADGTTVEHAMGPVLTDVHASPSKTGENTIIVRGGPCPPDF